RVELSLKSLYEAFERVLAEALFCRIGYCRVLVKAQDEKDRHLVRGRKRLVPGPPRQREPPARRLLEEPQKLLTDPHSTFSFSGLCAAIIFWLRYVGTSS